MRFREALSTRFVGMGPILIGIAAGLGHFACGGSARDVPYEDPRLGVGGSVATGGSASGGKASGGQASGGYSPLEGVGGDFEERECPDLPPEEYYLCDPLGGLGECGAGSKCSPYVLFPEGDDCGAVRYGAYCTQEGKGRQGDECSTNGDNCAEGYLCVVGTGGGARCASICDVSKGTGCPEGFLCGETDAQNIGVCY
jgi:hypothetical protein